MLFLFLAVILSYAAAEEILIVGGQYSGWSLQVFDPQAEVKSRIINGTSQEHIRLNHVGAVLDNSSILIVGGRDMVTKHRLATTALLNLNAGNARFRSGPPMNDVRSGAAIVNLLGNIVVCGGVMGEGPRCPLDTCEILENGRKWTHIESMRSERGGLALVVVKGNMYAIGGESWQGQCYNGNFYTIFNTAEVYDPDTKMWSDIAPMKQKRFLHTAATYHDNIYVCGGSAGDGDEDGKGGGILQSCERYDPLSNTWSDSAPMTRKRFGFGMAVLYDRVYAVGGSSIPYGNRRYHDKDTTLYSVEEMSVDGKSWSELTCGLLAKTYAPSVTVITDSEYRSLEQIAASGPRHAVSGIIVLFSLTLTLLRS